MASMDNIDEAIIRQNPAVAVVLAAQSEPRPPVDVHTTDINTPPRPTKEPRKFDQAIEENGCKLILAALTPQERASMSDQNLPLRHFRADKGDIDKAIKRIKYTIQWRNEFNVDTMIRAAHEPTTPEEMQIRDILMKESETGKMYVRGYDRDGRAILYIYQKRENSNNPEHNIMHLIYQLERMTACTERQGYEKSVVILDFLGWGMKHSSSMALTKATINILENCYVERIARVYFTNAPLVFRTFYNMVKPFLDPVTKAKIVFASGKQGRSEMDKHFDPESCEKCAFGIRDLKGELVLR